MLVFGVVVSPLGNGNTVSLGTSPRKKSMKPYEWVLLRVLFSKNKPGHSPVFLASCGVAFQGTFRRACAVLFELEA